MTLIGFSMTVGLRMFLNTTLKHVEQNEEILANMQLLKEPTASVIIRTAEPNPNPLLPGESLLDRIRRRGKIRVGYNEDKLPFSFFKVRGRLVGLDVDMAHALARDLGVTLELVRFDRVTLARQIAQDDFDVVMSGPVGTLERAEAMPHTRP